MYAKKTNNTVMRHIQWFALLASLSLSTAVNAQQWKFEPIVQLIADHNDNVRLNRDDQEKIDATALILDANGRFVRRTQTGELRIAPRVRSRNYTGSSIDDSNDVFFDLFARNRLERSEYGIQARLSQEDILTAEIDDPDFDNPDVNTPVNLDTGRIQANDQRDSIIVAPFLTHEWTETVGFGIDASYIDVDYDQNLQNLTDFNTASVGASLNYRTSERSTLSVRVYGNDYEAELEEVLSESQSTGAVLEMRHQFSETLEGRIGVGYENVDSDVTIADTTVSDSENSTLYTAGLTKRGEISRIVVDVSQSVDPSGRGFLQKRAQARLRYTRQLSPKMYGNFDVRIQSTEELAAFTTDVDRDFQRYRIGFEYRLTQKWSVQANYMFTTQDYSDEDADASANAVSIGFIYQPARIR